MRNLFGKKQTFAAPISGKLIPLEQVSDPVFAQKMMGDGFAIEPSGTTLFAPMSGTVTVCFPTHHAIGMKTDSGMDILLHVGIDTVKLNGDGFQTLVQQGQQVKQGAALLQVDVQKLKAKGYDPTVMVVFPERSIQLKEQPETVMEQQTIAIKL